MKDIFKCEILCCRNKASYNIKYKALGGWVKYFCSEECKSLFKPKCSYLNCDRSVNHSFYEMKIEHDFSKFNYDKGSYDINYQTEIKYFCSDECRKNQIELNRQTI